MQSGFISNVVLNATLELYMNSVFVAAKHTSVHHLKISGENICSNLNKGSAWQCYHVKLVNLKKTQKFCSNQTMVGCDELTLNSIQVAAAALRQHISETMPFVCYSSIVSLSRYF